MGVFSALARTVREALTPIRSGAAPRGSGGWVPLINEPSTGAWQRNESLQTDTVLAYSAVYACVSLIAQDIAKLGLRLVQQDANGIWSPIESSAFSPVLRKPNRYQTRIKFVEQWLVSKLIHGNTYVLKQRDDRGVVNAMYVLDPTRVIPLVTPSGDVYYELRRDDLSGLERDAVTVPASEIIHDTMVTLYHPLCGVSPVYACGLAALQGLKIQENSSNFFANAARPSGVVLVPGDLAPEQGARLKEYYQQNFTGPKVGSLLLLTNGMKYEPVTVNPVDAQLVEQLKWSAETVCTCYHVPPYMIGAAPAPTYNNIESLNQQYYSQCLQSLIESLELVLDEGLELPRAYGTEFNLDDLLRMDTETKTKAAAEGIGAGALAPNEARKRYFDLGPVTGGETPYLQQQNYSLAALARRDTSPPAPPPVPPSPAPPPDDAMAAMVSGVVLTRLRSSVAYRALLEPCHAA
jgi:phage portal protein, HK97 family